MHGSCTHSCCAGCGHGLSRRRFLTGCAAATVSVAAWRAVGEEDKGAKPRVALVFLSNSNEREIWPYPGFDTARREKEILALLTEGCPNVEFVPVVVARTEDAAKALELKDKVDGYLVYIVTLNWGLGGALGQVAKLGKPLLVADEFLGGCGLFLCSSGGLYRRGVAMARVSSTRPADLVAAAKCFGEVKKPGTTPQSFAAQCEEAYRKTFGAAGYMKCAEDKVPLTDIADCVKRLKESRFLIVGAGKAGTEVDLLGAKGIHVGFDEFKAAYEATDKDQADEWGRKWSGTAEKVVEPTQDWIAKAGAMYLAMLQVMKKHGTDSLTMNCLGGFNAGQLPAYPCLGFMQIMDDGGQGVCEAMPDDTVSALMARILTGRPGYVSDPALDTSTNRIVYAHCMAMTKVFGTKRDATRFRIRTLHNRDPRGTCAQSFLPEGYMTTTFRTSAGAKRMVIHQARATGNLDADRGCRTQLIGEVKGDIGKLFNQWDQFGWHRVTVYGDVKEPLIEFAKALGLTIVEEA